MTGRDSVVPDVTIPAAVPLDELLDGPALVEMANSFEEAFGAPLRIYAVSGALLADTETPPRLYSFLQGYRAGRALVNEVVSVVLKARPTLGARLSVGCVSGGRYYVSPIEFEGQLLGRCVVGPILRQRATELSVHLKAIAAAEGIAEPELLKLVNEMPERTDAEAESLLRHLDATLDLLVFSGMKAHMASTMHMASVKESYRELAEKNLKLQVAYDRLKELDRLKSNFLATVSHELRTPLTSIIGYSEMLLEGISGELTEEQKEFVGTIHEKGEQLLELIKSLLDLSKLESGTMSLKRRDMDCGELVREVATTLTPTARKKGVNIIAECSEQLPTYFGDAERLRQVLLNLAENAIKFTPGGGSVRLTAEAVSDEGVASGMGGVVLGAAKRSAIEIRVIDTGIGIPEDQRERVFDAFYQVDNSATREVGGTGLGLSIVKRLVDAHDGSIHIEENRPSGAVFVVNLPLKRGS